MTADGLLLGSVVDSLDVFALVDCLEATFKVRVPNAELTIENLGSVTSMARLAIRLQERTPSTGS